MLVTCPNCHTTFNIPDAAYVPGRKARCSNCAFVFPLPELGPDGTPESVADSGTPFSQAPPVPETTPSFPEAGPDNDAPAAGNEAAQAEAETKSFEDIISDAVEAAPEMADSGDDDEIPMPPPRKKKPVILVLLILLLVGALGGGGLLAYSLLFDKPAPVAQDEEQHIADLELSDMRQFVESSNEKIGRMVVVEGRVTNLSQKTKELIIIEASLFDKFGTPLAVQQQYCGISLPQFMLQVLSREEIKTKLEDESAILMNNTNILPGSSVPFITVFFNPPEAAYEFIVRIVDAKDAEPVKD